MEKDKEENLKYIFITEAYRLLDELEEALLGLDSGDYSDERINTIFRIAHTFKGSAKSVGFKGLARFSHHMEDLLSKIRQGMLTPTKELGTSLFRCMDTLRNYVYGLEQDFQFTLDTSSMEKELSDILSFDTHHIRPSSEDPTVEESEKEGKITWVEGSMKGNQTESSPKKDSPAPLPSPHSSSRSQSEDFLRVNLKRLDSLLNLVGELVVNQSVLSGHKVSGTTHSSQATGVISFMEKLVNEIKDLSISLRMANIRPIFLKLRRTARDVATELKKEVNFIAEGEHVEVDKSVHEKLGEILDHMIRNAIDHGIEHPEERENKSKGRIGIVNLNAEQNEDHIIIKVSDDGSGLNTPALIQNAIKLGLIHKDSTLNPHEANALIYLPGFSTKKVVTEFSGRGVGMDVVMRTIKELKGDINISTEEGKGTTFTISLPLSISIIPGMVIRVEDRIYVVPVSQLVETIEYKRLRIETSTQKGRMVNLRGEVIPVISLKNLLHLTSGFPRRGKTKEKEWNPSPNSAGHISNYPEKNSSETNVSPTTEEIMDYHLGIVTLFNGRKISFEIDEIMGHQQIVMKNLGKEMQNLPGIIGGTILSNGEPGLILNLYELAEGRKLHEIV